MKDPVTNTKTPLYMDTVFWKRGNTKNWRNPLIEESLYDILRTLDEY
jgi:hypothetical protein